MKICIKYKQEIFFFVCILLSLTNTGAQASDYWLPSEINPPGSLEKFQNIVTQAASPITIVPPKVVNIALILPSNDISDFWIRNYTALTSRLTELGIKHTTKIFPSQQIEHSLQTLHVNKVLKQSQYFDFVIFGPSELNTQAVNIQKLASSSNFWTFIWAFHTPNKSWQHMPKAWFDFSSSAGAERMCNFLLDRFGTGIEFVMNRGIPGITDKQRSGELKSCVESRGAWRVLYEHYGQYQHYGGYDGAKVALEHFPTAKVLHNANTAMAVGAAEAVTNSNIPNNLFITGWGGTKKELEMIKKKQLNATPMRMSDDVGVASAEAIKLMLAGRSDEIPPIYLGRITIASDDMSINLLEGLEKEAFRYSKSLSLNKDK